MNSHMSNMDIKFLNIVPLKVRNNLYQIIYNGISLYNEFAKENRKLINSIFYRNVKTRLQTFFIFRQFDSDMLSDSFPLKVCISNVNKYGYNALTLVNDKVKLSLAKTTGKISLPNKSKYRLEDCKNNSLVQNQLRFNIDDDNSIHSRDSVIESSVYIIIGYKLQNGELQYLNLMVPDNKMERTISNINLIDEYNKFVLSPPIENEYTEEQIASIKQEAKNLIQSTR